MPMLWVELGHRSAHSCGGGVESNSQVSFSSFVRAVLFRHPLLTSSTVALEPLLEHW
jgi:hypothetical protein